MARPGCAGGSGRCPPRGLRRPVGWPLAGSSSRARIRTARLAGCASGIPPGPRRPRRAGIRSTRWGPPRARGPRARPSASWTFASRRRVALVAMGGLVNVGPLELLVVGVIALLVLGPKRLPEAARALGRGMRELKAAVAGEDEDDPEAEPRPEP